MKVALPVYGDELSTVFDFAGKLLILQLDEDSARTGNFTGKGLVIDVADQPMALKIERLAENSVELLVCGAISKEALQCLQRRGIELIPFVSGSVKEVVDALLDGSLDGDRCMLPGSCVAQRRRWRRGARRRRRQCGRRRWSK